MEAASAGSPFTSERWPLRFSGGHSQAPEAPLHPPDGYCARRMTHYIRRTTAAQSGRMLTSVGSTLRSPSDHLPPSEDPLHPSENRCTYWKLINKCRKHDFFCQKHDSIRRKSIYMRRKPAISSHSRHFLTKTHFPLLQKSAHSAGSIISTGTTSRTSSHHRQAAYCRPPSPVAPAKR